MPPDNLILAFDTSAAHCAAAVFKHDWIVCSATVPMAKGQAEFLVPMLERLLADNRLDWRDLTALAVGVGPGNFTGVRISVAAARGLALGLEIPAVGVNNFEVMVWQSYASCLVSLEAPRGLAYVQGFTNGKSVGPASLIDPLRADKDLQMSNMIVVGHRAEEIGRQFEATWHEQTLPPIAETVAWIADLHLIQKRKIVRPAPLYVRPADAAPSSIQPPVIL